MPKQLLPLVGEQTMLQATAARMEGCPSRLDGCLVVCNEAHRFMAAEQLAVLNGHARFILEPAGRNTAAAAALAAIATQATDQDAILLIMPADHIVQDRAAFHEAIASGIDLAVDGNLVTFGIVPSGPETGYGYIEAEVGTGVAPVKVFVEKPDLETAKQYVAGGRHFWNSGMFMFSAASYLEELGTHAPEILEACRAAMSQADLSAEFIRPDKAAFAACPSDSIDYAVMEKTENAVVVPLDAGWSDVGSWAAVHEASEQDADNNAVSGDALLYDCHDTLVSGESRLVAAVGVSDLVIVETKDAVLVSSKSRAQDVRHVVEQLKADERAEVDTHRQVFRPWGNYDSIDNGEGFQVKRLVVSPGSILSLQLHHHRAEHWVVVRGTARVTLNDDVFDLGVNEHVHIPIGATHRIENPGKEETHIIEVQCGDYLGEDDIVRFDDKYGREGTNT
jgi:mannose-1-phosphate guanylyltransferase/mannose-6-phosphate isomerase